MDTKYKPIRIFFLVVLFIWNFTVFAQVNGSEIDITKNKQTKKVENIKGYLGLGPEKSKEIFNDNSARRKQKIVFDEIDKEIQNADFILKTGVDYKSFTTELEYVIDLKKKAVDGIINNKNDFQTVRNITVTLVMLKELLTRIDIQLVNVKNNSDQLTQIQNKIDSLTLDQSIFFVPKDSLNKVLYYNKFNEMSDEISLVNSKFRNALDSIGELDVRGNKFKFELQNDIVVTDNIRKNEFTKLFSNTDHIFKHNPGEKSFLESFRYSIEKEIIILLFFISNHMDTVSMMVLFVICIIVYLFFLKHKFNNSGIYHDVKLSKQIFKHPVASALLISFTLFNFFFIFPPFVYTALIWLISIFALTIVNKEIDSEQNKKIWRIYVFLILLGLYDNNILIHSVIEVYFILFLGLATSLYSYYILFKSKIILDNLFKYSLYTVIGFEVLSIIFILMGNYNLGKILMINGLITILMYYLFTNTYKLMVVILNYTKYLGETEEEKKMDIASIENIQISSSVIFILVAGWIVSIGKNSYFFQTIVDPFANFFNENRTLGDINYTYLSIVIFFLILVISVLLTKIVSFLSTNTSTTDSGAKGNKFGSWLLLIQIAIFAIGITIAFASAGIPIDRLTIIISALGVGIGFGLQTLVNNLVSGLIIAFEKPVNLDDIIEVGGQSGKMKSIGIRSSVVATFDGADVIIPNGDLLKEHLTNWTLGNNKKRLEINVGVGYGTDLENAKKILIEVMQNHSLILINPAPVALVTNFNDSSIDFIVRFWVGHISLANEVRSDMFIAIDTAFKANNIEIPFPKRDVYIKKTTTISELEIKEDDEK
ncbi:mechanosensitive ion channel family protein [Flavobacterium sp. 5]|uniref:mechanosensitive ion channel family protein n=1 Tax=Flavobacterium sp. 5 TaxID=2035199 RepID=UPI000C2CB74C|nr:mechanosensitive ion channel domain-containing protein [Flavobacterium sp. 5]PKB15890.1 mechanosensitive ion channel-like protein [Flavobacterium sp. 5]